MALDLEQKFISYLMHHTKYISEVGDSITLHHLPQLHSVYELIYRYYAKYGGIIDKNYAVEYYKRYNFDNSVIIKWETTMAAIAKYSHFDDNEWKAVLDELDEQYQKYVIRDIAQIIVDSNLKDLHSTELQKLKDNLQAKIANATIDRTSIQSAGEVGETAENRWKYYYKIKNNPNALVTYSTGFKAFDDKEGGFAPSELIYIIGRQGTGKSVLMLNLAYNMWVRGINVILFSLEISEKDYMRRFDSRAARISSNGLKRGTLSADEEDVYNEYLQKVKEGLSLNNDKVGKFVVVDVPGNCTPSLIEEKVKEKELELGVEFPIVISDYAGIMQPNIRQKEVRHNKAQIALELKQYARKYKKVVITAEQMNRQGKNQKETENDAVAESDGVTNHIDWGIAVRLTSKEAGVIESFKTRDGAPFKIYFQKRFDIMLMDEQEEIAQWDIT